MSALPETVWKRTAEMAAIFTIGDGMLGLFQPGRHVDLWRSRLGSLDTLVRPFADRPRNRRIYGAAQIAAGLLLASCLSNLSKGPNSDA